MTKEQCDIQDFMRAANQHCPAKPTVPSIRDCNLRVSLIGEELMELNDALQKGNLVLIADALADLKYVVEGTAISCGLDLEPIFNEVHRSNMSKFIDGHRREDGKWIKGPSYSPANLAPIIEEQIK